MTSSLNASEFPRIFLRSEEILGLEGSTEEGGVLSVFRLGDGATLGAAGGVYVGAGDVRGTPLDPDLWLPCDR